MLNRKKKKTPFLNDDRWDVVDSFTVPLPSTQLLPTTTDAGGRYACERGRFPDVLRDEWYGKIRTPRQLTLVEIEETTTGEVRNVMSRIHHMATGFAGRRMTRSDYDPTTLKEFEESEVVKRVSVVDFTNGYAVVPRGSELSSSDVRQQSDDEPSDSKKSSKHRQRTRSDFDETRRSVTIMQKVWRGRRCRKMIQHEINIEFIRRRSQAERIQHCWRERVRYICAILLIQSFLRAYPPRASFVLLREHCIFIQAWQRGKMRRRLSLMERKVEIRRMRRAIVSGWEECAVPLLQRSRLWTLQSDDSPSYLDVSMHRDEVAWLSAKRTQYGLDSGSGGTKSSEGRRLMSSNIEELPPPKYPNEFSTLLEAQKALKISRKDLYWRLKGKKRKHVGLDLRALAKFFVEFNISGKKKRKLKLANMVWTTTIKAEESEDMDMNHDDYQRCVWSSRVILACVEDEDKDWALRWRSYRVRINLMESLRASLVALQSARSAKRG
jgi:hypothetical protein